MSVDTRGTRGTKERKDKGRRRAVMSPNHCVTRTRRRFQDGKMSKPIIIRVLKEHQLLVCTTTTVLVGQMPSTIDSFSRTGLQWERRRTR